MLGEAQHRGVGVGIVVERITLCGAREGAQSWRELLVVRLVGSLISGFGGSLGRSFACRIFGFALSVVRVLIRLVVGVGTVVVFHSPEIMTANPATIQFPILPHGIAQRI